MLRKTVRSSARASANASSPHGRQSTGLCACWSRYGELSSARRLVHRGVPSSRRWCVRNPFRLPIASCRRAASSWEKACAPGPGSMFTDGVVSLPHQGGNRLKGFMRAYDLIRKKRDGGVLSPEELRFIVRGATNGEIADEQLAAFLMAGLFRRVGLGRELPHWLDAMLHSGEVLDLSRIEGRKVDKHSTGGGGGQISLSLPPPVAVCGVRVPMVSGRGLRSEEHTSELQSLAYLVCRLLLEKKKNIT